MGLVNKYVSCVSALDVCGVCVSGKYMCVSYVASKNIYIDVCGVCLLNICGLHTCVWCVLNICVCVL